MKSIEEMMKAAQEAAATVQAQMQEAQAKLDNVEVEGVSGGGLVRITATAKGRRSTTRAKRPIRRATRKWAR